MHAAAHSHPPQAAQEESIQLREQLRAAQDTLEAVRRDMEGERRAWARQGEAMERKVRQCCRGC